MLPGEGSCPTRTRTDAVGVPVRVSEVGESRAVKSIEVRMCPVVELGPETMKALKDMIETAIRELVNVKVQAPVAIKPEVLNAKRDGDRYRAQSTGMSGRGW